MANKTQFAVVYVKTSDDPMLSRYTECETIEEATRKAERLVTSPDTTVIYSEVWTRGSCLRTFGTE